MKNKWYALVLEESIALEFYIITEHNSAEDAIAKVFEVGGCSPNEYSKEFKELKDACNASSIISVLQEDEPKSPAWILASEVQVEDLVRELRKRRVVVVGMK